jgi:hypothetical protein
LFKSFRFYKLLFGAVTVFFTSETALVVSVFTASVGEAAGFAAA